MNYLYLLLVLLNMYVPQQHTNDCGVASVQMITKYYQLDVSQTSGEQHYNITDNTDRALHITEVVLLLREYGITTEYTYAHSDITNALVYGEYPMIYLLEDRVHFIVLYNGFMLDPKTGVHSLTMQQFINEYETGVGLIILE